MSAHAQAVAIEFYTSGVRVSDGIDILADSPSYACIEPNTIQVGKTAELHAYLRPTESSSLFWDNLLANSETRHRVSHAEIACRHLEHVWGLANCPDSGAILVTPVHLGKKDLGLLLGICEKLNIQVLGIVCNAGLALRQQVANCACVYLDLMPDKMVSSELIQKQSGLSIRQLGQALNYSLQRFTYNCSQAIAAQFIQHTRFDPLHSAVNEQQLRTAQPGWINALKTRETIECALTMDGRRYAIHLHRQKLILANQHFFDDIAKYLYVLFHHQPALLILCSASCKQVFGLHAFLSELPGCAALQLGEAALCQQALAHLDEISSGDQIRFTTALTWLTPRRRTITFNAGKLSSLFNKPSHLLIKGYAHSLHRDQFLSVDETDGELNMTFEKTATSICRVFMTNAAAHIEVFVTAAAAMNHAPIESGSSAEINDVLTLKGSTRICRFIKVRSDET